MGPLAVMGIGAGLKGIGNMLFGGGKDKEAKVDARNQTKLLADRRAMDQKALDRRRKILQGLRKFYSMGDPGTATGGGYLSKYGLDASRFGSIFGDLGADVGAEAYYLPQAPTLEAAKGPSWFQRLGQGLFEGATDYLNSPAAAPQMYPQQTSANGTPISFGRRSGGDMGWRPGSSTAELADFEVE